MPPASSRGARKTGLGAFRMPRAGHSHRCTRRITSSLDRNQVGDDFIERSARIQLMRATLPEERLDAGEVIEDHRSFQWSLPVVVRRSACDPVKDHVSRGAEQDDRVETVVELRLVPHAPFNEERATIIGFQQPDDPFLDPEPLPAVQLVGGLNILAILAPARITGVYDAITASAKSARADDLPVPDIPVTQDPRHRDKLPSVKRRRGRVGQCLGMSLDGSRPRHRLSLCRRMMRRMSGPSVVRAAARNNAEWCDAFCRTHDLWGRFRFDSWLSPVRTPPYYPDAVTLLPKVAIEQILFNIDASEGCSLKDSFARLDLTAAGFQPLIAAEWLVREPAEARAASHSEWSALTKQHELEEWEAAWADVPRASALFRPALLTERTIRVLAGYEGDRIVAGAVANRSTAVIGLSNVFQRSGDFESAWVAGAAAATALWGDMPIVGYDSGASLDGAHEAGFQTIGDLIVWLR